ELPQRRGHVFRECLRAQVEGREVPPECPRFIVRDPDPVTGFYRTVEFRFPIELGLHLENVQDPDWTPVLPSVFANMRIRAIKAIVEGRAEVAGQFAFVPLAYGLTDAAGNLIGSMSQRGPDSDIRYTDPDRPDFVRRYNAIGAGTTTLQAAV